MSPGLFDDFLPRRSTRGESFAPIPVCWPTLTDAEARARLDELADCWARHSALVEELSALRTGWLTAYAEDARGDAPLHWHTEFAAARQRLTDWTARTGCRHGEHRSAR